MLSIEISGSEVEAVASMGRVAALLENNPDILDDAGAFLLNRIRTRFLAEIDPNDVAWIPSQAAIERRRTGGTGTLFDSGKLFHSIQLATVGETRVIGTDVPYGVFHQFGTEHLPQRMFLGYSDGDIDILSALLANRIAEIINRALSEGGEKLD